MTSDEIVEALYNKKIKVRLKYSDDIPKKSSKPTKKVPLKRLIKLTESVRDFIGDYVERKKIFSSTKRE